MKKRFVLFSVLFMTVFIITVVTSGTAVAQKKPIILRLVVPSPAGEYPLTFVNTELARRFNERAKDEYKIEVHPGGALAKLPEYFDAVRIGAVEMACSPWPMYSFLDPRLGSLELPFLFNNNDAAAYGALHLLPLYDQILQEKFNAKGLGMFNLAFLDLLSNKPVKTLEDLKGLMVGAISPPVAAMLKNLGGSPVTIMWTDFYESAQKKVIDGVTNTKRGVVSMNVTDILKYYTVFYGVAAFNGFSINLEVWNKMPKQIQQILQEEATISVDWWHKTWDTEIEAEDVKTFKQKWVSIYVLPKAERERWVKAVTPYKEKQLTDLGEFGQKVTKIADEANKRYPYKE